MGKAERKKSEMMDMTGWVGFVSKVMVGWNEFWGVSIFTSLGDDDSFQLAFRKAFSRLFVIPSFVQMRCALQYPY